MQDIAKVWDKYAVQDLIAKSDKALARALWLIFQRQTAAERSSLKTLEHNGRGFTGHDAQFLSDVARRLPHYGNQMTARQIAKVRPMMRKYWRQLLEEIEAAGGAVQTKAPKRENAKALNHEETIEREPVRTNPLFGAWAM